MRRKSQITSVMPAKAGILFLSAKDAGIRRHDIPLIFKSPKGFSLIEVLLGLAISAIIIVCVYNVFWSAVKLDDKMRHTHDQYMEMLMADQVLTHDLENAVTLDFSASYSSAVSFKGQGQEFSFLTQTPKGIKHVRYYSGVDQKNTSMIGFVTNPSKRKDTEASPKEFLLREESSLADWLNETTNNTSTQIVAAGLEKDSFSCQYAPFVKNLHMKGVTGIEYKDSWDDKGLPMAVSCRFILLGPKKIQQGVAFKRDIFLAPLSGAANE
jgi:prepilin-type N-terminal cleavage/methylation domain-containing protein